MLIKVISLLKCDCHSLIYAACTRREGMLLRLRTTHGFELKLQQECEQQTLLLSGNIHILIHWGFNDLRKPLTVPLRINKATICINNVEYSTNKESVVETTLLGCRLTSLDSQSHCASGKAVLISMLTDLKASDGTNV